MQLVIVRVEDYPSEWALCRKDFEAMHHGTRSSIHRARRRVLCTVAECAPILPAVATYRGTPAMVVWSAAHWSLVHRLHGHEWHCIDFGGRKLVNLVIAGVPRAGKSTRAKEVGGAVRCTDDLIELGWSEASARASLWFDEDGIDVVEGVAALRALRKWLLRNPEGRPCARLLYMGTPRIPLNLGQRRMAAAIANLWTQLRPLLVRRGVVVTEE